MSDELIIERRGSATWLKLNRPEVHNAMNAKLYEAIKQGVRLADDDDETCAIVITGSEKAFSTGGDLREYAERASIDPFVKYQYDDVCPFDAIRDVRKPVVAAINGYCIAGGLILAASCDVLVASDTARFAITEARFGFAEPYVSALLFGRISTSKTKLLTFTGREFDSAEAERIGLISEVVPGDQLVERVDDIVRSMSEMSPYSLTCYKRFINEDIPRAYMGRATEAMRDPDVQKRSAARFLHNER